MSKMPTYIAIVHNMSHYCYQQQPPEMKLIGDTIRSERLRFRG